MENFWKIKPQNIKTPEKIIKEQCENLKKMMIHDTVFADVKRYDGPYRTSDHEHGAYGQRCTTAKERLQTTLGEQNNGFVYEFFIGHNGMKYYKYRIMFVAYNTDIYPTHITLDEGIAEELNLDSCEFEVQNEKEFESYLRRILGSEKISDVVGKLMEM